LVYKSKKTVKNLIVQAALYPIASNDQHTINMTCAGMVDEVNYYCQMLWCSWCVMIGGESENVQMSPVFIFAHFSAVMILNVCRQA